MNEDKKIKISSQKWCAHQERKNKFKDYSPKNIGNSNLISSEEIVSKLPTVS